MRACTIAEDNGALTGARVAQCQKAFFAAVQFGSASQRRHDLHELLLWSLVGLAAATVMTGILGWTVGKRVLVPLHRVTGAARRATQEHLESASIWTDLTTS